MASTAYPYSPASQGGDTSRQAAEYMKGRTPQLQMLVLRALAMRPMATFEIARAIQKSYRAIQPRTSELRLAGRIEDSGIRRIDPETGRNVIVWQLAGASI